MTLPDNTDALEEIFSKGLGRYFNLSTPAPAGSSKRPASSSECETTDTDFAECEGTDADCDTPDADSETPDADSEIIASLKMAAGEVESDDSSSTGSSVNRMSTVVFWWKFYKEVSTYHHVINSIIADRSEASFVRLVCTYIVRFLLISKS